MAPESINFRRFTTASDVWMFGQWLHLHFKPSVVHTGQLWLVPCYFSARRRVHVGNPDVWHQALPGRQEQWRHRPDRERRAAGHAPPVPAHPLQPDDKVLVVRPQQKAAFHWAQDATQVSGDFEGDYFLLFCFVFFIPGFKGEVLKRVIWVRWNTDFLFSRSISVKSIK